MPAYRSIEERFWEKVDKSGDCWLWTAATNLNGYGVIWFNQVMTPAPRVAVFLTGLEIPDGMCVCHTCDNPPCVNPSHLFIGSYSDNLVDMVSKGRANRPKGERSPFAKMTDEGVLAARAAYAEGGALQKDLAEQYGVSKTAMRRILIREKWAHI